MLEADLVKDGVELLFSQCGYPSTNLAECLEKLKQHLKEL